MVIKISGWRMFWVETVHRLKLCLDLLLVRRRLFTLLLILTRDVATCEKNTLLDKWQHFKLFAPVICLRSLRMLLLIIIWNCLLNAQSGYVSLGAKSIHFVFSYEILIIHWYTFTWTITAPNNYEPRKCWSVTLMTNSLLSIWIINHANADALFINI
jgi:hypothetical protein